MYVCGSVCFDRSVTLAVWWYKLYKHFFTIVFRLTRTVSCLQRTTKEIIANIKREVCFQLTLLAQTEAAYAAASFLLSA